MTQNDNHGTTDIHLLYSVIFLKFTGNLLQTTNLSHLLDVPTYVQLLFGNEGISSLDYVGIVMQIGWELPG